MMKKRQGLQISGRMKSPHPHSKRRSQTMSEKIVQLNEEVIKGQRKELVRGSVEMMDRHALYRKAPQGLLERFLSLGWRFFGRGSRRT